jgi:hypothetical protein
MLPASPAPPAPPPLALLPLPPLPPPPPLLLLALLPLPLLLLVLALTKGHPSGIEITLGSKVHHPLSRSHPALVRQLVPQSVFASLHWKGAQLDDRTGTDTPFWQALSDLVPSTQFTVVGVPSFAGPHVPLSAFSCLSLARQAWQAPAQASLQQMPVAP